MECARYAIWWVPHPDSGLARFGAEWTGWCADCGIAQARRMPAALTESGFEVPERLRRRGLHAPIGTAFRPAPGRSVWALGGALAALAGRTAPILLPRLRLDIRDGRVVLVSSRPVEALAQLLAAAAETVCPLQVTPEYATLKGAGRQGRESLVLTDDGRALIDARRRPRAPLCFHLPLTGRIANAEDVAEALSPVLEPILAHAVTISDIALAGDPGGGRPWRLLERFTLDGDKSGVVVQSPAGMDCLGPRLLAPLTS